MPTLESFLEEQEKIYDEFRRLAAKTKKSGLKTEHSLLERRGGFFAHIVHSPEFSAKAEALSRKIASSVPAISYDAAEVHTTLGCYKPEAGFVAKVGEPCFENDLRMFTNCIREALDHFDSRDPVAIDFDSCLYSEEAVIAAGHPNRKFVDLVVAIQEACATAGIEVRPPWGAHVTLCRFTENVPSEWLRQFFAIVDGKHDLGKSTALGLNVGYPLWKSEEENRREKLCGRSLRTAYFPL